jgi:drug/metabolite transporter (DMT)-like permease
VGFVRPEAVTQLGNVLTVLAASPWMFPAPHLQQNGLWLLLLGGISLGVPYLLYSRAIRDVKALDATLITMLEPILNPIWVMIAVHERPSGWLLVGGCLVLSASLARSILVSRDASRLSESSSAARIKRALANP